MKRKICSFLLITFMAASVLFSCFGLVHKSLSAGTVPVMADSRESIDIPIIMYHGITGNSEKESEYVISADRFEKDLIWLEENGYTTVLPSQLINYVKSGARMPARPVILSFDDGFGNNYTLAYPLLQKHSAKAVFALIGSESDLSSADIYRDPGSSNMTWGEVAIMARSGLAEFANHTYSLHKAAPGGRKGADRLPGESFSEYRQALLEDIGKNQALIEKAAGKAPQVFAWPYGAYPKDGSADQILMELGFDATFVSWQHTSSVKAGAPETLYGLGRWLRTPEFRMESIIAD